MSRLTVKVTVSNNRLPFIVTQAPREADRIAGGIAKDINQHVRNSMSSPKSGRVYLYSIGGRVISHQASAPGESPAILTRRLVGSLQEQHQSRGVWYALSNDGKAPRLEYGSGRIRPRPFYRPAANQLFHTFVNRMIAMLKGF